MEYRDGKLYITGEEFVKTKTNPSGLVQENTYRALRGRGKIKVYGRGGNGRTVLIEFESLPDIYKNLVRDRFGDPYDYVVKQPILDLIKPDLKAVNYFYKWRHADTGLELTRELRVKYGHSASILRAVHLMITDKAALISRGLTKGDLWAKAVEMVRELQVSHPHSLPGSERWLRQIYSEFFGKEGINYEALISGKLGNQNRRKVDDNREALLLSLYCQSTKPYAAQAHALYEAFMKGEQELFDVTTGELFEADQFFENGRPVSISYKTVWLYINKPANRVLVDKYRLSALQFQDAHRPHMHRHAPNYSMSKVTIDDIEIPFKLKDGSRIPSYQVFDVKSGACIGASFGREKNAMLLIECLRDLARNCQAYNLKWPAEIETEQHIASSMKGDILAEGNLFSLVTYCRGGNPQEKRAEGFIKGKKYTLQNRREGFQRRPFARLEANRMNQDADKVRYTLEDVIANERKDIEKWNNSPHPRHPGKSRWGVLIESQHPDLLPVNLANVSRWIGEPVKTSIRRRRVQVNYAHYEVPDDAVVRLEGSSQEVTATYLPTPDGIISRVYLWQGEKFIASAEKIQQYNESRFEQTDQDRDIMKTQFGRVKRFDGAVVVGRNRLARLATAPAFGQAGEKTEQVDDLPVDDQEQSSPVQQLDEAYWQEKAKRDLYNY